MKLALLSALGHRHRPLVGRGCYDAKEGLSRAMACHDAVKCVKHTRVLFFIPQSQHLGLKGHRTATALSNEKMYRTLRPAPLYLLPLSKDRSHLWVHGSTSCTWTP